MSHRLNPQQLQAVHYTDGPLLVLAGAGSGKTGVITQKIAHLIRDKNYSPKSILAVTFTNKAAREMVQRIGRTLPKAELKGLNVSTFHNFGLKFLSEEHKALGFKGRLTIFDNDDTLSLLRELSAKEDSPALREQLQLWARQISNWKGDFITPNCAHSNAQTEQESHTSIIYQAYQKQLKSYNAVDFDDLIMQPLLALTGDENLRSKWQDRVRYVLVDEYQDTNASQYALIKILCYPRGALTVVGDDHQSVYAWRGARPENMMKLRDDFPQLKLIKLEQNYRSTPNILNAANHLIAHNPVVFEKKLWSSGPPGALIRVILCKDDEQEAARIAAEVLSHKFQNRGNFKDYAILYRSNHQARVIERALRESQIPYQLSGGTSFFSRVEVRDILSYLRLLNNTDDDAAFLRVVNTPKREIGPQTLQKLSEYARQRQTSLFAASFEIGLAQLISERALERLQHFTHWLNYTQDSLQRGAPTIELIHDLLKHIRYEEWLHANSNSPKTAEKRMNHVLELIKWLERLMQDEEGQDTRSLHEALNTLQLMDILERQNEEKTSDALQMMTLHSAKGLEFPHVFMTGLEEGLLPHKNSLEADTLEEERRLCYVGITRAISTLNLTYVKQRKRFNEVLTAEPSRFLQELPPALLELEGVSPPSPEARAHKGETHLAALRKLLEAATQ